MEMKPNPEAPPSGQASHTGLPASSGLHGSAHQVRRTRRQGAAHSRARGAGGARGDGWERTAEDERMLAAATRYGVMTQRQAAEHLWSGQIETARKRIRYMREAGLIRSSDEARWAGPVVWPTQAGARVAGLSLRAPEWPGERLLHRLAVVDVGLAFEASGARVVTERELRKAEGDSAQEAMRLVAGLGVESHRPAVDGRGRERYLCVPLGTGGQVHYPDLVVAQRGGLTAIEVEITSKTPTQWKQILRAYQGAPRTFRQVVYMATEPIADRLRGRWNPSAGEWSDGIAQQVGLLPPGPVQDHARLPLRVRAVPARDPGVLYQLHMRQVPDTWRVPMREWKELYESWQAQQAPGAQEHERGFLEWWGAMRNAPRQ